MTNAILKEYIYVPDEEGFIDGCAELVEVGEAVCESELEELAKKFIEVVKGEGRHYPKGSKFTLVEYDSQRKVWTLDEDDEDDDRVFYLWDTEENRNKYFEQMV